ncbi:MAG: hypothetical protein HC841_00135 [Verrucomicrobiae bacterium]|nr:hypothetical protein [Verrucomicrobiae bacterium]
MTLESYLRQGDEIEGKAAKRPWLADYCRDVFDGPIVWDGDTAFVCQANTAHDGSAEHDAAFIADARQRLPKYAKLIRALVEIAIERCECEYTSHMPMKLIQCARCNRLERVQRGEFDAE